MDLSVRRNLCLPDECGEVDVHVQPGLEPLRHAQRGVRPHPAVLVEQEDPDHVALCLQQGKGLSFFLPIKSNQKFQ